MTRDDALNSGNYPVRTETTDSKHIMISHICYTEDSKSKYFLVEKNLSQVFYMGKDKSKIIIVNESSTEDSKS